MNCAQCQAANAPGTTYCVNCGGRLNPAGAPVYSGGPGSNGAPGNGAPAGSGPAYGGSAYGGPGPVYGGPVYGEPTVGRPAAGPGPAGYGSQPGPYQPCPYQPGQSGSPFKGSSALPPVRFDLGRLAKVDKVVAGATLVTMISIWLPWFSASYSGLGGTVTGSVSGTHLHGWLWLEFLLALVLLGYLAARAAWDELPVRIPVAHELLLIAATGLQFLLVLIGFLARPSTDGLAGYSVSWDFGAFLALIGSLVAAGPVIYPAVRAYLDSRKGGTAQRY
jgi:hypothetical protein